MQEREAERLRKEAAEQATQEVPEGEGIAEVIEELTPEQEIAELQDKNIRLLAEMDNLRKRAMRDSAESRKYASLPLVNDLLAMTDNLQSALSAADQASSVESLKSGVEMVLKAILQIFEKHNCQIFCKGPFSHPGLAQKLLPDIYLLIH